MALWVVPHVCQEALEYHLKSVKFILKEIGFEKFQCEHDITGLILGEKRNHCMAR